MPRGIPNKPKAADVEEAKPRNVDQELYTLYVQGKRIQEIADKYHLEPQEVIEFIETVEQSR